MYSERTLRRKAAKIGYGINKGYQHWLDKGYPIFCDCNGEKSIGYQVIDYSTGFAVWGSYDRMLDHLWSLGDVEQFLKEQYEKHGLDF